MVEMQKIQIKMPPIKIVGCDNGSIFQTELNRSELTETNVTSSLISKNLETEYLKILIIH